MAARRSLQPCCLNNEALLYAALTATIAALALSFLFSRSVVAPVLAMSHVTQRIADGRYDERLQVVGVDELAQLAARFNQMAERLDRVESMRRRLIGDVSHEPRTPLTAIKGSMEGLMDGVLPANEETFQQIHAEADHLNHLVDDLQELSRVEARAYQLDFRPLDVSSLVQTVTKRLAPQAQSKRISLDFDLTPDRPYAGQARQGAIHTLLRQHERSLEAIHQKAGTDQVRETERDGLYDPTCPTFLIAKGQPVPHHRKDRAAGGVQNSHPHRFRHTFAIQFLRNGGNIYTLKAILGHTSLDMTKRYLYIAQTDIARDHEKASPVKGWGL
jgi:HAMP domain-containing protein